MRLVLFGCVLALAGCDDAMMPSAPSGGGGAFREQLVIGGAMTFEQCRAKGGLIIKDAGSPMTACDPNVIREPVPRDEFNNPAHNGGAATTAATATDA